MGAVSVKGAAVGIAATSPHAKAFGVICDRDEIEGAREPHELARVLERHRGAAEASEGQAAAANAELAS